MKYYIGIDGGGTKTQFALFDENKNMLSDVKTSGSNHENLEGGIPEAASVILSGIKRLLDINNLDFSDIEKGLFALAGIDHKYQCDSMTDELKKAGVSFPFSVFNDGFIVVKAGLTGKSGIGYNCGTGTCCNSVDSDGKLLQIGGLDIMSGDTGGGHWISREAFIKVYDDVCLKYKKTIMTELTCKKFRIDTDREGVLSLVAGLEAHEDFSVRTMIDVFFEALAKGDEAAVEIADAMAFRGAQYISAHIKNQHFEEEEIEVVLSGSIHTKLPSEIYINKLHDMAEKLSGRKLKFIRLDKAPVTGCINWMLEN